MADLPATVRAKKLSEFVLPGSHDSGAFTFTAEELDQYQSSGIKKVKEAVDYIKWVPSLAGVSAWITDAVLVKAVKDWGRAQNVDIYHQLQAGIRWFDLRTMMYQGGPYLYHGFVAIPMSDVLANLDRFVQEQPGEITTLYFSHMDTLSADDHVALANSIQTKFGAGALCTLSDYNTKTYDTLQSQGVRLVVFYDSPNAPRAQFPWLLSQNSAYYDPGVDSNEIVDLTQKLAAKIAANPTQLPLKISFTTTPEPEDIGWSIANQFNAFSDTHDLHWFTEDARDALPPWLTANSSYKIGILASDFIDEIDLLNLCLARMGVVVPPTPTRLTLSAGATLVKDKIFADDRPYAYAVGSNGHLWQNWWDGSNFNWTDLGRLPRGGSIVGALGAIAVDLSRPYCYVVGSDGHLWQNFWDNNEFQWNDLGTPPNVAIDLGLGLTLVDTGRPYAYVRGTDGHMWQNMWDGNQFNWCDLGTPGGDAAGIGLPMGTVTPDGGRPYCYVRGIDGSLWQNMWDGSQFHWVNLGTPASNIGIQNALGVTNVDNGRPYCYMVGTDGHMWQNMWDGNQFNWCDLGLPAASVGIDEALGTTTVDGGRPYCYVRGTDGHMWQNMWDGNQFNWCDLGVPPGGVGIDRAVGAITVDGGRPYCYFVGTDGGLWQNIWDGNQFQWVNLGA
jgi:hypothetical protein